MIAEPKKISTIIEALKSKGYIVYEKPYQLNIVGVRSDSTEPNKFNDFMYVFWKNEQGKWEGKYYNVTTDPATYFLKSPINKLGAAILKEGQYVDAYGIGKHQNSYDALVQYKPVTVYRDYNRDAVLDFNNGKEETGVFKINIHKAGVNTKDKEKWSAGCQVFENLDDFENFMSLVRKHKDKYGNTFTYTLIDERAANRQVKRYGVYAIGAIIIFIAGYIGFKAYKNK